MSEPEKPKRRFWQLHLSTALVMMFVSGPIVWANTAEHQYVHGIKGYGFPFYFYFSDHHLQSNALFFDAVVAAVILGGTISVCESRISGKSISLIFLQLLLRAFAAAMLLWILAFALSVFDGYHPYWKR